MNEEKIKAYLDKVNQESTKQIFNKPKIEKPSKGPSYQEIDDTQKLRLEALKKSNIDFKKHGWTVLVADLLSMPSQKVRKWMMKWAPEMLEEAHIRVSRSSHHLKVTNVNSNRRCHETCIRQGVDNYARWKHLSSSEEFKHTLHHALGVEKNNHPPRAHHQDEDGQGRRSKNSAWPNTIR